MRSLVFLALAVITYGVNGAKPSKLGRYNQTPLLTDCKKPPAVCNCNLTVNQDSQVSGAMKTLDVKLDKLVAQNLDKKVENLEKNSKKQLEKLTGLINKSATGSRRCDHDIVERDRNLRQLPQEDGNEARKTYR